MLVPGTQQIRSFHGTFSKTINADYLLYLPKDYEMQQQKHWPLILFLHGAGERGKDVNRVKSQGLAKMLQKPQDFPFIVVSPQCAINVWWHINDLDMVLDEVMREYRVDIDRIYVTGLSMGGFGTWALAIHYPHRFAAIAPICGGGNPTRVCAIKHVPVWTFHGAKDEIVPLERSKEMVEALKKCGGHVLFTVYPEADHDSWTQTYANPQLYDWLLECTRNGTDRPYLGRGKLST